MTNREFDVAMGIVAIALGAYAVYAGRRCWSAIRAWRSRTDGSYGRVLKVND